ETQPIEPEQVTDPIAEERETPLDFDRDEFIHDLDETAPQTDPLLDEPADSEIPVADDMARFADDVLPSLDESDAHGVSDGESELPLNQVLEEESDALETTDDKTQDVGEEVTSQATEDARDATDDWLNDAIADVESAQSAATEGTFEQPEQIEPEQVIEADHEEWFSADEEAQDSAPLDDDFEFEPQIEGTPQADSAVESEMSVSDETEEEHTLPEPEPEPEPEVSAPEQMEPPVPEASAPPMPEAIPNEFGVPQDDDWLFDETPAAIEPEASATDTAPEPIELSDEELPEYDETSALADSDDVESAAPAEPNDSSEPAEYDLNDLPEYDEDQALADVSEDQPISPEPAADEQDALFAAFQSGVDAQSQTPSADQEQTLNELLAESDTPEFNFEQPIDATLTDSAGMDIDAMLEAGGEDWNGFSLSPEQQAQIPDEIPEDEQGIWNTQTAQPQVQDENWANQEQLTDFDPKSSQYKTIDELMAEMDMGQDQLALDEEELKLDVGLNEFPDVIGDIGDDDVDANAEAAGKLDLAKIYMEMNDASGAKKLLEEAIVDGSDDIRREAKHLIDVINAQ
ncbi:FimV/HubP family polar landmark protein, partial [Vibrio proteolyticus]